MTTPVAAWGLTILFVVLGAVSLVAAVLARSWIDRASYIAHVIMCTAMVIMVSSWGMRAPMIVEILVFTALAFGYVALALFRPRQPAGPGDGHHASPVVSWYHAVMMAAMVWMAASMSIMASSTLPVGAAADAMPGMAMAGTPAGPAPAAVGPWSLPPWTLAVTLIFVAVFAAAAVWFFVQLVRVRDRHRHAGPLGMTAESVLSLGMAAGMGASFLLIG